MRSLNLLLSQSWISYRGSESTTVQLAYYLQKKGHTVKIVAAFVDWEMLPENGKKVTYILPVKPLSFLMKKSRFLFAILSPFLMTFLIWKNSKGTDLLLPFNLPSSWASVLVGKIRKIPVVWTCSNGPLKFSVKNKGILNSFFWFIGSGPWDKWLVRQITEIVVVSPTMGKSIKDYYGRKSRVITPGVNFNFFSTLAKKTREFKLLSVGSLDQGKNQKELIKAFFEIEKDFPYLKLVLAGEGPEKENLEKMADKDKKKIKFTGFLNKNNLRKLYSSSCLLVLPSKKDATPLAVFEAMAAGLPVLISTQTDLFRIFSEKEVCLFAKPNRKDLKEKIIFALENPYKINSTAERALKMVKNEFTWEEYTEKYERIFKNLVKEESEKSTVVALQ